LTNLGYKEVPKTIRTNWTGLIVFEIGNEREVFVIYEEFAMGLKMDQWLESYKEATKDDHSFLFINFQQPRSMRMWKNFEQVLFHRDDDVEVDPKEERNTYEKKRKRVDKEKRLKKA